MRYFLKLTATLVLFLLPLSGFTQIIGFLELLNDNQTYQFSVVPQADYTAPFDITNNAQVTFRAPAGAYTPGGFTNVTGVWSPSSVIYSPTEAPDSDYFSFVLSLPLAAGETNYTTGQPIVLFTFRNENLDCEGGISIMTEDDPFSPPNTQEINVINYFSILGFGPGNAYGGTLGDGYADCPEPLDLITPSDFGVPCNGTTGSTTAGGTGGAAPYQLTYENLDDGSSQTVTLATLNSTTDLNDLSPGLYTLTLVDSLGQSVIDSVLISEPDPIEFTLSATPASCTGSTDGSAQVATLTGGTGNYEYTWSNSATDEQTGNLAAGFVALTVTDANGCTAVDSIAIDAENDFTIGTLGTDATCAGIDDGSIEVTPQNGNAPYQYTWSGGIDEQSGSVQNLPPATYFVTVVDATGVCAAVDSVVIAEPNPMIATAQTRVSNCIYDSLGVVEITSVTNGEPPYLYGLNNEPLTGAASFFAPVGAQYTVTVEDVRGCITEVSTSLPIPIPLEVDILQPEETFVLGNEIRLEAITSRDSAAVDLRWSLVGADCDTCSVVNFIPTENQRVFLTATDTFGCVVTTEFPIILERTYDVFVPDAFSPNNDGMNDEFHIYPGPSVASCSNLRVFNRWGVMVYQQSSPLTQPWRGNSKNRQLPDGSYVFSVDIEYIDGKKEVLSGTVGLLR